MYAANNHSTHTIPIETHLIDLMCCWCQGKMIKRISEGFNQYKLLRCINIVGWH